MRAGLAMGLRLGAGGRRGALPQIVLTAVGVAVGVTLVLLTLTVLPAMEGHRLAGVVARAPAGYWSPAKLCHGLGASGGHHRLRGRRTSA
jgi:hypothetical protein